MMEAIQEVMFYIILAYKYNGLSMKSNANIMHLGNDRTILKIKHYKKPTHPYTKIPIHPHPISPTYHHPM